MDIYITVFFSFVLGVFFCFVFVWIFCFVLFLFFCFFAVLFYFILFFGWLCSYITYRPRPANGNPAHSFLRVRLQNLRIFCNQYWRKLLHFYVLKAVYCNNPEKILIGLILDGIFCVVDVSSRNVLTRAAQAPLELILKSMEKNCNFLPNFLDIETNVWQTLNMFTKLSFDWQMSKGVGHQMKKEIIWVILIFA